MGIFVNTLYESHSLNDDHSHHINSNDKFIKENKTEILAKAKKLKNFKYISYRYKLVNENDINKDAQVFQKMNDEILTYAKKISKYNSSSNYSDIKKIEQQMLSFNDICEYAAHDMSTYGTSVSDFRYSVRAYRRGGKLQSGIRVSFRLLDEGMPAELIKFTDFNNGSPSVNEMIQYVENYNKLLYLSFDTMNKYISTIKNTNESLKKIIDDVNNYKLKLVLNKCMYVVKDINKIMVIKLTENMNAAKEAYRVYKGVLKKILKTSVKESYSLFENAMKML